MRKCALLVVLISISAYGAVHNVPSDYSYIQAAVDAASSGDTIQVAPGFRDTHWELQTFPGSYPHGAGGYGCAVFVRLKDLVILGHGPDSDTIDGAWGPDCIIYFGGDETTANRSKIEGFTLMRCQQSTGGTGRKYQLAYFEFFAGEIKNCVLTNEGHAVDEGAFGIRTFTLLGNETGVPGTDYCSIDSCIIRENGFSTLDGRGIKVEQPIVGWSVPPGFPFNYANQVYRITNCIIENNGHLGIRLGQSVGTPDEYWTGSPEVKGNIIRFNGFGGLVFDYQGRPSCSYNLITHNGGTWAGLDWGWHCKARADEGKPCRNNTICYNSGDGIRAEEIDAGTNQVDLINNIVAYNSGYGIHEDFNGDSARVTESYNDVWNNTAGDYQDDDGYPIPFPGTGEISADPLFIPWDYSQVKGWSSPRYDSAYIGSLPPMVRALDFGWKCEKQYTGQYAVSSKQYGENSGKCILTRDSAYTDSLPYHLQYVEKYGQESPCIDAGDPDPSYNDPDGTRNDMGCYPIWQWWGGAGVEVQGSRGAEVGLQIYPNPFTQKTVISYRLSVIGKNSRLRGEPLTPHALRIYDLTGRLVKTLIPNPLSLTTAVKWDGRDDNGAPVPGGVYFCQLKAGNELAIKKIILVR